MVKLKSSEYAKYSKFLSILANKLNKFYFSKLNKPFKVSNKSRGKGYDPVTNIDKAFEKFISKEIKKKFKEELQDKPGKYVKLGKDNWDFSVVLSNAKRNLKPNGTYSLRTTGFYNIDDINAGLRAAKIYIKSYKFNKSAKRTEQIVQILEKIIEDMMK